MLARYATFLLIAGCATEETSDCDGHGTFVHGHCHCESGFQTTEDELGCMMVEEQPMPEPSIDFMPTQTKAFTRLDNEGKRVWVLEAVGGAAVLQFEVYAAYGGPTMPGTYPLAAVETSYKTCGTCLLFQTGCSAHDDHFHCDKVFMPHAAGSVTFTALGTAASMKMTGSVEDLMFQEVSIADDLTTTPVASGDSFALDAWAFDVALTEPQ
ncbi:MAG: hypothetical protein SFX73_30355 [Kofleriaceae bacterium]|nr:hypothetical protein [Kofleriaceae bacterium]